MEKLISQNCKDIISYGGNFGLDSSTEANRLFGAQVSMLVKNELCSQKEETRTKLIDALIDTNLKRRKWIALGLFVGMIAIASAIIGPTLVVAAQHKLSAVSFLPGMFGMIFCGGFGAYIGARQEELGTHAQDLRQEVGRTNQEIKELELVVKKR